MVSVRKGDLQDRRRRNRGDVFYLSDVAAETIGARDPPDSDASVVSGRGELKVIVRVEGDLVDLRGVRLTVVVDKEGRGLGDVADAVDGHDTDAARPRSCGVSEGGREREGRTKEGERGTHVPVLVQGKAKKVLLAFRTWDSPETEPTSASPYVSRSWKGVPKRWRNLEARILVVILLVVLFLLVFPLRLVSRPAFVFWLLCAICLL